MLDSTRYSKGVETCNSHSMLVNIHFSKYHIWKRKKLTNTSTRNMFGFAESFHKHLMTGPKGNSEFCFPETLNGPETKP